MCDSAKTLAKRGTTKYRSSVMDPMPTTDSSAG